MFAYLAGFGWVGVPFFFVISGYCIAAAGDSARFKPRAVAKFFLRRFRRIYPPFWILLLLSFAIIAGTFCAGFPSIFSDHIYPIVSPFSLSPTQWVGNISLTETWRHFIWGNAEERFFLGHAWTLCYEEQFYAICGLALFLNRKWFFLALAWVSLFVVFAMALQCHRAVSMEGFFFDGRWLVFAAGVLIYYRLNYADGLPATFLDMTLIIGLYGSFLFHHKFQTMIGEELIWGFLFACVIRLLHCQDLSMASSRWLRPVSLCGVMCYSLYLVHWPVVKGFSHLLYMAGVKNAWLTLCFTMPACIVISVGLAWRFHTLVERRFLNTIPSLPEVSSSKALLPRVSTRDVEIIPVNPNFFRNFSRKNAPVDGRTPFGAAVN